MEDLLRERAYYLEGPPSLCRAGPLLQIRV